MSSYYKKFLSSTLPEGWKLFRIGDIADVTAGGTPSTSINEYWGGEIPWMNSGEINKRKITEVENRITELGLNNSSTKIIKKHSVLIALAGQGKTRGKVAMNEIPLCTNQSLAAIYNFENITPDFVFFNLESRYKEIRQMSTGDGGRGGLNLKIIKSIGISIPPISEQQKIAEILSTVDDKIEVIDQQIRETKKLKKGLMQRLLTKGIGHTEFKDSPLGEIPVGWEVVKLEEIAEVKGRIGYRGYTKADLVKKGNGALTIGGGQISKQNKLDLSQPVYLNWDKYEESPEIKIKPGNIVFAQRGTLGRTALIGELPEPATINPSMVLIKDISCNELLLYYYLCSDNIQNIVRQISTATAVPMISQKQIKNFRIALPPESEQDRIVNVLRAIDQKIDNLINKRTEYRNLKKGLMQQLLTGKVRVKV